MILYVFIFVFLFRTNGKEEHLDESNFRHSYGNYLKSAIREVKVLSQQLQGILTMTFERHISIKDFTDLINILLNSFLGKYHETKMGEGFWKIISCTKILECSSRNILSRHLLITAFLFFSQTNPVFKFNLMLIK